MILAETDVPSAEVLALKLEAQKRLVALVEALAPPFRETVLLHYFDGRSSVEIARAKGIPEGTVRWRLKTGLDCIRRALRLEDESKSRGRPASLLLLVECKDGPLRPWSGFAIPLSAAATLSVLGAFIMNTLGPGPGAQARSTMQPALSERESKDGPSAYPRSFAATIPLKPDDLMTCQSMVAALRKDLVVAEAELRRYGDFRAMYDAASPNHHAQAAIAPIIDQIVGRSDAAAGSHQVDCRNGRCRVLFLCSTEAEFRTLVDGKNWTHPDLNRRTWNAMPPETYQILPTPSGEALREYAMNLRLIDPDGAAVDGNLAASPNTPPPAPIEDCLSERELLKHRLQSLLPMRNRVAPPELRFPREPFNEALTTRTRALVSRVLGSAANPAGIRCHDNICRIPFPGGPTLSSFGRLGSSSPEFDEASRRLAGDPEMTSLFGGGIWKGGGAVYVRVPRGSSRSGDAASALLKKLLWLPAPAFPDGSGPLFAPVSDCRARHQATGVLHIDLVVPAAGELNPDGKHDEISVHVNGSASNTDFGRCVSSEIGQRIVGARLPQLKTRFELSLKMGFP